VSKVTRLAYERYKPQRARPSGKGAFGDFVAVQLQETPAAAEAPKPALASGPVPIGRRTVKLL
jgi:hypothetical protein